MKIHTKRPGLLHLVCLCVFIPMFAIQCDLMGGRRERDVEDGDRQPPDDGKFRIFGRIALSENARDPVQVRYTKRAFKHSGTDTAVIRSDSVRTDSLGLYLFDDLDSGDYLVSFSLDAGPYRDAFLAKRADGAELPVDSLDGFLVATLSNGTRIYLADFSASGKKDIEVSKLAYHYSDSGNCDRFILNNQGAPDFLTGCASLSSKHKTDYSVQNGKSVVSSESYKLVCEDGGKYMWDLSIHDITRDGRGVALAFFGEANGEACAVPQGSKTGVRIDPGEASAGNPSGVGWNLTIAKAETLRVAEGIAGNLSSSDSHVLVAVYATLGFSGAYSPRLPPDSLYFGLIDGVKMYQTTGSDPQEAFALGGLSLHSGGDAVGPSGFLIGNSLAGSVFNPKNLPDVILIPPASTLSAIFLFQPARGGFGNSDTLAYGKGLWRISTASGTPPPDPIPGSALLGALSASPGTMTPPFAPGRFLYADSLPFPADSLYLHATPADSSAKVTVDGTPLAPPGFGAAIGMGQRQDSLTISVDNPQSGKRGTYTIRLKYGKPYIKSLAPSAGSWTPSFATIPGQYTLSVSHDTDTLSVALGFPEGITGWKFGNQSFSARDTLVHAALSEGANDFAVMVYGGGDSSRYDLAIRRLERAWLPVTLPANASETLKWVKDIQRHPKSQAIYVMGTGFPNVPMTPGSPLPFIDIIRGEPAGKSWSKLNSTDGSSAGPGFMASDTRAAMVMAGGDAGGLSALGFSGQPFETHDSGKTWSPMPTSSGMRGYGMYPGSPGSRNLYLTGNPGLWRGNGSNAWKRLDSALAFAVSDFTTDDDNELFVVNRKSGKTPAGIYCSPDGGNTWTSLLADTSIICISQAGTAPRILVAGTSGGGILRSADDGETWSRANSVAGSLKVLSILNSIRDGNYFYAATTDGVFESKDLGETWSPLPKTGLSVTGINAILEDTSTKDGLWVGTQGGGLFRW